MSIFERSQMLLGENAIKRLNNCHVAVFGVGGVGGSAAEALARAGVGALTLIDNDTVSVSNINRQIVALHSTIGMLKVDVMAQRTKDINPEITVNTMPQFITQQSAQALPYKSWNYIIDAIDTVSAKLALCENAANSNVPVISAMGAGNKLDPTQFCVTDIFKTENDPLARVMRRELRKMGIKRLKVVYSTEGAHSHKYSPPQPVQTVRRQTPASVSFVPGVAGMILAGQVIKDLIEGY